MKKPGLPQDMVEEILCRVPATYLKRLRPTCKAWNRLFKDDWRFAREHCEKALKELKILMLTKNMRMCPIRVNLHGIHPSVEVKTELSLPDPHSSFQFDIGEIFHCDGLLLCTDDPCTRIVVWNPFTGGTWWIKDDRHATATKGTMCISLGYSQDKKSCSKSYKLLSYSDVGKKSEIYEFSSDSWRIVDHDIAPGWNIGYTDHTVSLKGNTYWFAVDKTKTHPVISLLGFDFSTEKCGHVLPLPYQRDSYVTACLSVVGEEKFSVLLELENRCQTEVWVTNKIDDETTKRVVSWSKVLALDLSLDLQFNDGVSFFLEEEKKLLVWYKRCFDMEDDDKSMDMLNIVGEDNKVTLMDFGVDTETLCWPVILHYFPSLAQIERAGCKRKRGD